MIRGFSRLSYISKGGLSFEYLYNKVGFEEAIFLTKLLTEDYSDILKTK